MRNKDNKIQVLSENYNTAVKDSETCEFAEWVKMEAQSDPNFYRWLFDDDSLQDFSAGEYEEEFNDFCNEL